MIDKLFEKTLSLFSGFILLITVIGMIGSLFIKNEGFGLAESLLSTILILTILLGPVIRSLRRKHDIFSNELQVFGGGYYFGFLSKMLLINGFGNFVMIFIPGELKLFYVISALVWFDMSLANAKKGLINLRDYSFSAKGREFLFDKVHAVNFKGVKMIVKENNTLYKTLYKYDLSQLDEIQLEKFIDLMQKSKLGNKINVA